MILTNARIWSGPGAELALGSIAIDGDRIAESASGEEIDLGGRLVTPALIDCHTHLVHGGQRSGEWALRMAGAGYEEIARAGGGIVSTVAATRAASEEELLASALPRLDRLIEDGVGTVEVKSGYGLDAESELRMLRVARRLAELRPVEIKTSYLAAHAVPPEYKDRSSDYIDEVVLPTLTRAHAEGLVDAVDGFCEGIAFSVSEMERIFNAARELGLPVKLHAEQLSHLGGTQLAARFGALSADHLEYANDDDARAMGKSGTVAVLLPGAYYALRETQAPPVAAFREHGVNMAVATDLNPGTSPVHSLLLAMNMACTLFGLTVDEAMAGATTHAATALGLTDRGRIAPGQRADLAVWDANDPAHLIYRLGLSPLHMRIIGGRSC